MAHDASNRTDRRSSESSPARRAAGAAREHWLTAAALLAALASMAAVPPDAAYLGYFDWKTIGCLFCVLAVTNALRRMGAIDRAARAIIGHVAGPRSLALISVLVTAVFSMLFTNDVALIIMLPLAVTTLVGAGQTRLIPLVFALQALAANLCGMITPFGNPQNLYLFTYYHLGVGEFVCAMLPPFVFATTGIVAATWAATRKPRNGAEGGASGEGPALAASAVASRAPLDRRRLATCCGLFALTLLAVFRVVPAGAAALAVATVLACVDRQALANVDWGLLATFLCFFVFAGNMARIPALGQTLGPLMDDWGLLVSAGTSQVISNVPAAVLLSHFTGNWAPLLVGVNIGGAGTFVGSLASLIAIRCYAVARKTRALQADPDCSMGRFLRLFALMNAAFFAALVTFCQLMECLL
ncbi:citrate transporter [Eggerthellaceae bacterium zg-893]|nr:citrate transporter [Eggerthellaceae bacterium zg-893]